MKLRRVFFGGIRDGRLARLPFLAWSMLLMLLVIGFGLALGAFLVIVQNTMGGDPAASEAALEAFVAGPLTIPFALIGLIVLFAQYNLVAKRVRDIGLPGWPAVLAVVLLTGIAAATVAETAVGLLNAAVGLVLVLVPGDALRRAPPGPSQQE